MVASAQVRVTAGGASYQLDDNPPAASDS